MTANNVVQHPVGPHRILHCRLEAAGEEAACVESCKDVTARDPDQPRNSRRSNLTSAVAQEPRATHEGIVITVRTPPCVTQAPLIVRVMHFCAGRAVGKT
jgi:hypothetical protein